MANLKWTPKTNEKKTLSTIHPQRDKRERQTDRQTHAHTHTHIYIYICVCVCVCVYASSQINSFVVSQGLSVARPARYFKLGSKSGRLYVVRSYPRDIVILSVSEGFFYGYLFMYTLSATRSFQFLRSAVAHACVFVYNPLNVKSIGIFFISYSRWMFKFQFMASLFNGISTSVVYSMPHPYL